MKAATPSGKGPKKGATNWYEATPVKRSRPAKIPRSESPVKPVTDDIESGKKRHIPVCNENSKRTRIASPTTTAQNESLSLVSEMLSKSPLTDKPSAPSNKEPESSDIVPSSHPEADALLAGDGPPPPQRPAGTLGVGTDTGQSSQGSIFDHSQSDSIKSTYNDDVNL